MPLNSWNAVYFFDPMMGEEAIRVTGFSGHGAYWVTESLTPSGKSRRAQRERVLRAITAAIESGDEPGEVSEARRKAVEAQHIAAMIEGADEPAKDEGYRVV